MRVLVGVQMGDGDAGGLELANLRNGFALDLARGDAAAEEVHHERGEAGAQASLGRERGEFRRMQLRAAIHEDDMASDAERGLHECGVHRFAEGAARRHQRCGGQHFGRVQLQDGAVHAFRQTEIIGIDDEAALRRLRGIHATSLASAGAGAGRH